MTVATYRIRKLDTHNLIVSIRLDVRELRVRMAIGLWLIKLGAQVIGMGVKVEVLKTEPASVGPPAPPPDTQEERGG